MSLTVTQQPNQNDVWVAAKNPVLFKMTRKDYTWTLLVTSTGNTSIRIATDVTAEFVAGDTIWLQSDDGAYSASGAVVSSSYGTYTTVITDVPWVADNAAGYINTITQRANYYISLTVYKKTVDTVIGTVINYPTTKGLLTIDISQPLQTVFDPSIAAIYNGVIIQDSNVSQGYYVKYTEFWSSSAESPTTDNNSGNYYFAAYGARQIGSSSYYKYSPNYLGTMALTVLDSMSIAVGEYFSLSYLSQGGQFDFIKKSWYDASGTLICITYIKSTNNTTAYALTTVPPSVYTLLQKLALSESINPDLNIAFSGSTAWSSNSLLLATGDTSKTWCSPFFLAQTKSVSFTYSFTLTGNATNVTPVLRLFDANGSGLTGAVNIFTGSNGTYTGTVTITNSGSADARFVGFEFANASGANKTLTMNSLVAIIDSSATRIDFKGIQILYTSPLYTEGSQLFGTISGYFLSCLKNPVTLMWRNSLGGESSWTFNFNQELIQKLQDPFKNKQYTLFDQNLTLAQYNALNELFTLGQIYQTPLIELTTSIDKTESRIGQQVYTIDSSGNKIGVIVLPTENKTTTKRNRHTFQATIELPEIFG